MSTDKHVLSNEQITLQSTHLSSTSVISQTIRNDSVGMDMSMPGATKNALSPDKMVNFEPLRRFSTVPPEDKENYAELDDMDFTIEFPPPSSSKHLPTALFQLPKHNNWNSSVMYSSSTAKISMGETSAHAEKTNGSDNMDISGIEPTEQNERHSVPAQRESEYSKWLKSDNFLTRNRRQTQNQMIDIGLDETPPVNTLAAVQMKTDINSRKTIHQPLEMSLEVKNQAQSKDISGSSADMSIETKPMSIQKMMHTTNDTDMELSHLELSKAKQRDSTEEMIEKANDRRTVSISRNITTDNIDVSKLNANAGEISVQYWNVKQAPNIENQRNDLEMSLIADSSSNYFKKPNLRRTINKPQDITIDEINASNANRTKDMSIAYARPLHRETLLQPQCMNVSSAAVPQDIGLGNSIIQSKSMQQDTIAETLTANHLITEKRSSRRETLLQSEEMDLDSPLKQKCQEKPSHSQQKTRQTINKPHNISVDEKLSNRVQMFGSTRRQTTHTVQDISLDTSCSQSNVKQDSVRDISLDDIQSNYFPAVQQGNPNWKRGASSIASRVTINEPRDMSFDCNASSKSNTHSRYNKTIVGDMSMDLQSTDIYAQLNRKSVICQSPNKNATTAAFDRSSLEFTKLIDVNNFSYHPLHSTKLNDKNCSKFTNFESDSSAESSSDDGIERNGPTSTAPAAVATTAATASITEKFNSFELIESKTVHVACDLDMSEAESPIPTAKKFNLNKTPYYAGSDQESFSSSLELTATNFNDENLIEPKRIEKQSVAREERHETKILHETINDDSRHINVPAVTTPQSMDLSNVPSTTITVDRPKARSTIHALDDIKRLSMPSQSLFQLSSIGSPININTTLSSNDSAPGRLSSTSNVSIGANESSKQLTFIEDDDDEEQICNTKIDLANSLDNSDNGSGAADMLGIIKPIIAGTSAILTSLDISHPSLCEELNAFKKSNRLRHSNVFESSEMSKANRSDTATSINDESTNVAQSSSKLLADIGQSQIMQRRNSNSMANDDANDTSFLKKKPDIKASEITFDWSGYEELEGLATPIDVFNDFLERMEQIRRQDEIWADQYRKFEAGEIDNFDDDTELDSQNVEAPTWTFLYKNKMDEEL